MTIERRIELEPIDSFQKAMEYDDLDHRETNERFVDDLLASGPLAGDVLDIGTGTALIPIELCLAQPGHPGDGDRRGLADARPGPHQHRT